MKKPPLFIGNNLAILVCAHELAKSGAPVTLLCDDKPLGGHFMGSQINGYNFDIGMVLLEMREPVTLVNSDLRYNRRSRNDWTRFGHLASNWLKQQSDLIKTPTASCLIDGRRVPDYLISNRLDVFSGMPIAQPSELSMSDLRHASNKIHSELYDHINYADAATLNHGQDFHDRFIEPFVQKLMGVTSSDFLARYHRAAWAPLYYPETLARAIRGEATGLPEYLFWTTPDGYVGEIVGNLRSRLQALPNVDLVSMSVDSLKREGVQWKAIVANREYISEHMIMGVTSDRAASLLGYRTETSIDAASVCLLFARVHHDVIRKAATCLFIVDSEFASYRLTDQDNLANLQPEWHRITLEAGPERLKELYPLKSIQDAMTAELYSLLGINAGEFKSDEKSVEILKCVTANNALGIPSAASVAQLDHACDELMEAAPGAFLTGNLLGYGVASLNDQIVQGLIIAEELL